MMPSMTLTQAAQWSGKSRSTIFKAIKAGRISKANDEKGHILIDPAELERAFKAAPIQNLVDVSQNVSGEQLDIAAKMAALKAENAMLRESLTDAREQRDKAMMLAEAQTRLLTHQQEQKQKIGWNWFRKGNR